MGVKQWKLDVHVKGQNLQAVSARLPLTKSKKKNIEREHNNIKALMSLH